MKRIYLRCLTIVFILTALPTFAQHHIGFYLNGSVPLNQLKDSGYRDGIGFSFEYLSPSLFHPDKTMPLELRIGAGVEFLHYGSSQRVKDLVFNTPNNDKGSVLMQNQMVGFYIAPRLVFNTGKISPYIDVLGAIRGFNSYQVNRFNENVAGYERSSSKPVVQNGFLQYGGSVGLLYHLNSTISFDARVSYSTGQQMKFVDLNSVKRDPAYESNIAYRNITSPVSDILTFRLGVLIRLTKTENTTRTTTNTPTRNTITISTPTPKPAEVKPVPKPAPPVNY